LTIQPVRTTCHRNRNSDHLLADSVLDVPATAVSQDLTPAEFSDLWIIIPERKSVLWAERLAPWVIERIMSRTAVLPDRTVRHGSHLSSRVRPRVVMSPHTDPELRLPELFGTHPVPICLYDPQTLRLLAVNLAMATRYGYAESELLGMTLEAL